MILDPDWASLVCLRVAPGEAVQYLGVVTGADTDTPNLRLTTEQSWRFPTPEIRESLRGSVLALFAAWKERQ
ncbi:hypothetical protein [Glycomyces tenuis]|uniref:hypothetical protein n=1 Tax=Glycomyces tenuis TaxID=58116 RepID=UPI00047D0D50|nr:hypothetical protein [Glycomyces tenuis]